MNYRTLKNLYFATPVLSLYDGDGGVAPVAPVAPIAPVAPVAPDAAAAAAAAAGGAGLNDPDPNAQVDIDPNARFDQDMVNKIVQDRLAKDRKKHEEKYNGLKTTYQDLLASETLSQEDRTKLEQSLEDLKRQHRTKEEQAKHEKKQLQDEYEDQLAHYKGEAVRWETEYKGFRVEKSLLDAAIAHDAFMPSQILSIVREWTKLVDVKDENDKPTGQLTPMVDLPDVDADSQKPIITQHTPMGAIERLKELQPNLFKSNVVSGVGGNSTTGGMQPGADGRLDQSELTTEQWMKAYKEDPTKLGLRSKMRR